jgi:hypothetical protein
MATSTASARRPAPIPTDPGPADLRRLRRRRAGRRAGIAALILIVAGGLSGFFGYRTGHREGSGGGYELSLSYPEVGRPGVPIQWILHVHRDAGLPPHLDVATSVGYFDILDLNDVEPQPASSTEHGDLVVWTFDTTGGSDLTIAVDAFVANNAHVGNSAVTSILEDGRAVASVSYTTRVAP